MDFKGSGKFKMTQIQGGIYHTESYTSHIQCLQPADWFENSRQRSLQRWEPGRKLVKIDAKNNWLTNGEFCETSIEGIPWVKDAKVGDNEIMLPLTELGTVPFTTSTPKITFVGIDNELRQTSYRKKSACPASVMIDKSETFKFDPTIQRQKEGIYLIPRQNIHKVKHLLTSAKMFNVYIACALTDDAYETLASVGVFRICDNIYKHHSRSIGGIKFAGCKKLEQIEGVNIPEAEIQYFASVNKEGDIYLKNFTLTDPSKASQWRDEFSVFSAGTSFSVGGSEFGENIFAPVKFIREAHLRSKGSFLYEVKGNEMLLHVNISDVDASNEIFVSRYAKTVILNDSSIDQFVLKKNAIKTKKDISQIDFYRLILQADSIDSYAKELDGLYCFKSDLDKADIKAEYKVDKNTLKELQNQFDWITARIIGSHTLEQIEDEDMIRKKPEIWIDVEYPNLMHKLIQESNSKEFMRNTLKGQLKIKKTTLKEIEEKLPSVYYKYLKAIMKDPYTREALLDSNIFEKAAMALLLE